MNITMLKSKIHNATITNSKFEYEGSIEIASDIMDTADIKEYEKVLVVNFNNGMRYETYVLEGPTGSNSIEVNGAGARYGLPGDKILIMTFAQMNEKDAYAYHPKIIILKNTNEIEASDARSK